MLNSTVATVDVESATPLSSIKKHLNGEGRVDRVVAVIKSCTPNGFGDMTITLKVLLYSIHYAAALYFGVSFLCGDLSVSFQDPTGSVGATVYHRVFTEGNFGKDITVGSVLLLQKVLSFPFLPSLFLFINFFFPFPFNEQNR